MGKAILVALAIFVAAIFIEANIGPLINCPGVGTMLAISIVGGIIVLYNEKKK